MLQLPPRFTKAFVDCGDVKLNVVSNAPGFDVGRIDDERPPIIFLHGFPEYWAGWKPVFERMADEFLIIAPDQRGYNLSDAPDGVDHYQTKFLVADIAAMASRLIGERKFILAGHDWGASVAYAFAIGLPERLNGLVIANGVHPVVFQRALIDDPEQSAASQYIHRLRKPRAAERMAEDGYGVTLGMFEKFSSTPWLTDEEREGYVDAWSQPGRLDAMLNWYRASPLVVPEPGQEGVEAPLASAPEDKFQVPMPHLLIWGTGDQALRPSSRAGLEAFAPDLTIVEIPEADHWVIHTHGERIAAEIRKFASRLSAS